MVGAVAEHSPGEGLIGYVDDLGVVIRIGDDDGAGRVTRAISPSARWGFAGCWNVRSAEQPSNVAVAKGSPSALATMATLPRRRASETMREDASTTAVTS